MAIVLRHSDCGVQAAMRHPALAGLKTLARGAFCQVYDKGDTVLKLTCDSVQYWFSADYYAPEGPYFPRLVKDHGNVGATRCGLDLYLIEMEKLAPLGRKTPIEVKRLSRSLIAENESTFDWWKVNSSPRRADAMRMESVKSLADIIEREKLPADLLDALEQLKNFVSNHDACIDIHSKNLMMRGDQLVLNDVVCDSVAVQRLRGA